MVTHMLEVSLRIVFSHMNSSSKYYYV